MILLDQLSELRDYPNWVVWRSITTRSGFTKMPFDAKTHRPAMSNDQSTWSSFDDAHKALSEHTYDGIGFELQRPFLVIDIDHCIIGSKFSALAIDTIARFDSTYIEYSPSGTGIHIIAKCDAGRFNRRIDLGGSIIDIFNCDRYITITQNAITSKPISSIDTSALLEFVNSLKSIN